MTLRCEHERGADPNRAGADGMTFGKMLTDHRANLRKAQTDAGGVRRALGLGRETRDRPASGEVTSDRVKLRYAAYRQ